MDTVIEDDELGCLIVRVNPRARSLVFRTKSDAVYVSVPPGTTMNEVKRAIENLRNKLLTSRRKVTRPLIDLNYKIDTEFFRLQVKKNSFWLTPDWEICRLYARPRLFSKMKIYRIGCVK